MADGSMPGTRQRFHHYESGEAIEGLPAVHPCPFCRRIEFGGIVTVKSDPPTYHVQCDHCGADGPCGGSPADAAQAWNAANDDRWLDRALDRQLQHLFAAEAIVKATAEAVRLRYGIDWPLNVPDYPRALGSAATMIACAYDSLEMMSLRSIAEKLEAEDTDDET